MSISYQVNDIPSTVNHNAYMASSSAPQIDYVPIVHHPSEFSSPETGLVVPIFQDDPIDAINHNLTLPALQDDLILSVIEQLKTQVVNCTKINQDNKQVNELLTAELE
nr:hypothetical protein [Tanacetum cinerariifolium]